MVGWERRVERERRWARREARQKPSTMPAEGKGGASVTSWQASVPKVGATSSGV